MWLSHAARRVIFSWAKMHIRIFFAHKLALSFGSLDALAARCVDPMYTLANILDHLYVFGGVKLLFLPTLTLEWKQTKHNSLTHVFPFGKVSGESEESDALCQYAVTKPRLGYSFLGPTEGPTNGPGFVLHGDKL